MPQPTKHLARVDENGRLPLAASRLIADELKLYAGRDVEIRLSRPARSSQANRYYWGCVLAAVRKAAMESGQAVSAEALHGYFKTKYLDPDVSTVAGVPMVVYTTTQLDSTQFFEYVENIRNDPVVLSLGCHIPDPETPLTDWRIG